MPVFKNEDNGTWYVMARYVNWYKVIINNVQKVWNKNVQML